jgi:hypothetical protein
LRLRRLEVDGCGSGGASGTNGYGFPRPSRVSRGDGVPYGKVLSHRRVLSSSFQSRDGRGADGGRLGAEQGELARVRSHAVARSEPRAAAIARRRRLTSSLAARRVYRRLSRCAHLARPPLSWPDSVNSATLAHRQRRSRVRSVARDSLPGGVTGRDRRTSGGVTARDRIAASPGNTIPHTMSAAHPTVSMML